MLQGGRSVSVEKNTPRGQTGVHLATSTVTTCNLASSVLFDHFYFHTTTTCL